MYANNYEQSKKYILKKYAKNIKLTKNTLLESILSVINFHNFYGHASVGSGSIKFNIISTIIFKF